MDMTTELVGICALEVQEELFPEDVLDGTGAALQAAVHDVYDCIPQNLPMCRILKMPDTRHLISFCIKKHTCAYVRLGYVCNNDNIKSNTWQTQRCIPWVCVLQQVYSLSLHFPLTHTDFEGVTLLQNCFPPQGIAE
jgi:hypothetical protein